MGRHRAITWALPCGRAGEGRRVRGERSEKGLARWLLPALRLDGQAASRSERPGPGFSP